MRFLQFDTDCDPNSLGKARRRVHHAFLDAGLSIDVARDMEVAVGEAFSNVREHAYTADAGRVSVRVFRSRGAVTAVINDDGRATRAPVIPRVRPSQTKGRGRGLYLMGRLVDDVTISVNPTGHGLTVQLTTRLKDVAEPPSAELNG